VTNWRHFRLFVSRTSVGLFELPRKLPSNRRHWRDIRWYRVFSVGSAERGQWANRNVSSRRLRGVGAPCSWIDSFHTIVPTRDPMPAVSAMASAPQNVTRAAPIKTPAPPA
jgi:hypothetical protein